MQAWDTCPRLLGPALIPYAEVRIGELMREVPKAKNQYESALATDGQSKTKTEAVLDAEVRIGELMRNTEKSVGGRPSKTITTDGESFTKAQVAKSIGLDPKHLDRFETLAAHPEIVAQAKAEAKTKSPTRKGDQPGRAFCNAPRYEKPIL